MAELNLNDLRTQLDEYERFAKTASASQPVQSIAAEMLGLVADARRALQPSPNSTANYVESKQVIERLAALRETAEKAG